MSLYTVQLFAFDSNGDKFELDLYQEEAIKITISAESITDIVRIDSSFSRSFRIPATNTNSKFFSWWFEASVVNFDVTQRVKAEIHVDGLLYRTGQLRLQSAFINPFRDNVDLEVVFLGETKDFSTEVGDGYMNSLDLGDTAHDLTLTNVENSWLDFGDASLLFDGKLRYIPAIRGYTYNAAGVIQEDGEISRGKTQSFTSSGNAINIDQLTITLQIKYLIDKIFDLTSYTYSASSIFNETWFQYLYTDAISADSSTIVSEDQGFEAALVTPFEYSSSIEDVVPFDDVISNPVNAYSDAYIYTVPADGSYTITANPSGVYTSEGGTATTTTRLYLNGSVVDSDVDSTTSTSGATFTGNVSHSASLTAGDTLYVTIEGGGTFDRGQVTGGTFQTTVAPNAVNVSNLLKSDVKLIDFFKSVLTKFRLVMVPSKENDNEFIIKTWNDYIGRGDQFDWTGKLDGNKDVIMKPVFFNQSANIEFTDVADEDSVNKYHQEQFNRIYGSRFYDSGSDLLVDTRKVETVFAPTPAKQIPGDEGGNFIVPYLSVFGTEPDQDGETRRLPLTPQPRLLYWNGFVAGGFTWYYTDGVTTNNDTDYPRMTYVDEVPTTSTALNLNWNKAFAYFALDSGPVGNLGEDVFQRYWQNYIDELYSPDSRMLTAYFTIDAEDLRDLTFDDAIFIKDSWWRILKVHDAPLTDVASVKVDLLKLLNGPITGPVPTSSFTWEWDEANDRVQFTDTSTESPTSWVWTFSSGTPSSTTDQNPTLTGALWDNLTVTLTASNANGTGSTASETFQVVPVVFDNVQYWWRGDSGITNGTGTDVAVWADQINGFEFVQPSAALQPFENTSTNLNNKEVIQTNGTSTYMYTDQSLDALGGNDWTMLVIYEFNSTNPGRGTFAGAFRFDVGGNRLIVDANFTSPNRQRIYNDGWGLAGTSTAIENPLTVGPHALKWRFDNTNGDGFYALDTLTETANGTGDATPTTFDSLATNAFGASRTSRTNSTIFGSRFMSIKMAEQVWIYGSPDAATMTAWKDYVNTRYGTIIT